VSCYDTPIFGSVATLAEMFTDLMMCPMVVTKGYGSRVAKPSGMFFLSTPNGIIYRERMSWFVQARVSQHVLDAVLPRCCSGGVGSFEIIPWKDKALVCARDGVGIASPWLAFIPLDQVPLREQVEALPMYRGGV